VTAAGGEAIGHAVAERLGYRYVDDEVITLAAETAGIDPAVVEGAEHERSLLARLIDALVAPPREPRSVLTAGEAGRGYYGADAPPMVVSKDDVRQLIQRAIVEIARRGEAVIVAHAASYALDRYPDTLRVFVTASNDVRLRRLWLPNKLVSEDEYAKAMADSDHQRQRYLARFYDVQQELPTHYDLVANTDRLDLDQAVAAIVAAATR
jgi:hypothetical protein